jgi:hypothetical protein
LAPPSAHQVENHHASPRVLFVFLSGTSLSEAIWMLYLAFRGMSLVQIGLIESVFHVTSMLMEVPTGIVADRFGRKTSRLLSRIVAMIGTALMIGSRSFWGFSLAFVARVLQIVLGDPFLAAVRQKDVVGAVGLVGAVQDQFFQPLQVPVRDRLWNGELHGHLEGHADLLDGAKAIGALRHRDADTRGAQAAHQRRAGFRLRDFKRSGAE